MMQVVAASPALVAAVSSILVQQMATALRAGGVSDRRSAVNALKRAGFGAVSVLALVDRALGAAGVVN